MKTRRKRLIAGALLAVIMLIVAGFLVWDNSLKRSEKHYDIWDVDGAAYREISFKKIAPYKESNRIVCKSKDGTWTLYEIEEYPDREYIVARTSWQAMVLEQVGEE